MCVCGGGGGMLPPRLTAFVAWFPGIVQVRTSPMWSQMDVECSNRHSIAHSIEHSIEHSTDDAVEHSIDGASAKPRPPPEPTWPARITAAHRPLGEKGRRREVGRSAGAEGGGAIGSSVERAIEHSTEHSIARRLDWTDAELPPNDRPVRSSSISDGCSLLASSINNVF